MLFPLRYVYRIDFFSYPSQSHAMANLRPDRRLSSLRRIHRLRRHGIRHLRKRAQEETENASHTGGYGSYPVERANPRYRP